MEQRDVKDYMKELKDKMIKTQKTQQSATEPSTPVKIIHSSLPSSTTEITEQKIPTSSQASAKQDIKPIDPQEYLKQMKEKLKKKKEPPITSVISDEKEITTGMQSAGIEQQKNIEIQLPAAPQQVKIQTTIAPSDITQPILKPTIYLHATDETKKFNRPLI